MSKDELNGLSEQIIGAAIRVHRELGPGLLESAYEACLEVELLNAGFHVERQVVLPVIYCGINVECGYRLDLRVNQNVILEIKAVERFDKIHEAQIHTYLRLTKLHLGLLLNFNVTRMVDGVKRIVRDFPD